MVEDKSPLSKEYLLAAAVVLRQAGGKAGELDAHDLAVLERVEVSRDPAWLKEELTIFAREYERADLDLLVTALHALSEARDAALVPVFREVLERYLDSSLDVIQQVLIALDSLGEVDTNAGILLLDRGRTYRLASEWLRGRLPGGPHN